LTMMRVTDFLPTLGLQPSKEDWERQYVGSGYLWHLEERALQLTFRVRPS
jgi:hypothetical protein